MCLLALAALLGPLAVTAENGLPASQQVPLLLKILTYDRQLAAKAGSELTIGIVYVPGNSDSAKVTSDISGTLQRFTGKTVKSLPIRHWTIEYVTAERLEAVLREKSVNVIYVSPGNERNLATILRLSKAQHITTTTGVPEYVKRGVAVGIGSRQGKPEILINLESSKSEGSEFDAGLLRMATVVQ